MNPEGLNHEDMSNWKAPETREAKKIGFMQKLTKLPGLKVILIGLAAIAMAGGLKQESKADPGTKIIRKAKPETNFGAEWLSFKSDARMRIPAMITEAFHASEKKGEGFSTPNQKTLLGDMVYASGESLNLTPETKQQMSDKELLLEKIKKEIEQKHSNKTTVQTLEKELEEFAKEVWGENLKGKGKLKVDREGINGKTELRDVSLQWCRLEEVKQAIAEHVLPVGEKLVESKIDNPGECAIELAALCANMVHQGTVLNMAEMQSNQ